MTRHIRSLRAAITVLSLLVPARAALAQVRDNPPRQSPRPAPAGIVSGHAVVSTNGQAIPLRRARVTLTRGPNDVLFGQTDTEGRFEFTKLGDGEYSISVEKAGFVTLGPPTVASVRGGKSDPETIVMMGPGAAISGRVVDERGDPFKDVDVALDRLSPDGSRMRGEFSTKTDALGDYRIHSLPAGEYRVHARAAQDRAYQPVQREDEIYYPGVTRVEEARVLRVAAGQDLEAIDLSFTSSPKDAPAFMSMQLRGADNSPLSGAGRLRGRVTRPADGMPVPNALVRQASMHGQGSVTRADDQGGFEFIGLADGKYALTAQAPEFANSHGGAYQSFAGARIASLEDGRPVDNVQLMAQQGMTIEGRVLDEFGDPVPGVRPQLAARAVIREMTQLVPIGDSYASALTDDLGRFQFLEVAGGDYYIQVISKPFLDSPDGPVGFAPTYFPGTDQMAEARPIHVEKGIDVRGLVIPLVPANTLAVSGRVVEPSGQPVQTPRVQLIRVQAGVPTTTAMVEGSLDGAFAIDDVPPGAYVVHVRTPDEFATVSVLLSGSPGESLTPFTVVMQKPLQLTGRVVVDGAPGRPVPSGLSVIAATTDLAILGQPGAALVGRDGTFTLGVRGGAGLIRMARPVPGWAIEAVRLNGVDVTTTPFDLQRAIGANLEVVLTSRIGSIAGRVVGQSNVVPDALVAVVPDDRSKWTMTSALLAPARVNLQGDFNFGGLLPGRYLVFTFQGLLGELDRAQIESHAPFATPVVVVDGQETGVEITAPDRDRAAAIR